jgi:excisionase family DNA binding protein
VNSPDGNTNTSGPSGYVPARPHGHRGGSLPKFYTVDEVAEALDVCPRTVRRWIKSGALPVHRIKRIVRVSPPDLSAFLAARREV